jgi:hypothetical protein
MRGVVLYKSHVVERVQDAGGVLNMGANQNGGDGGKMGNIYSSSCNFLVQLVLLVEEHKRPSLDLAEPSRTS